MLMFGLFFVIGQNINNAIKGLEKEQGMQVFMYPEATDDQIEKLKEEFCYYDIKDIATETSLDFTT